MSELNEEKVLQVSIGNTLKLRTDEIINITDVNGNCWRIYHSDKGGLQIILAAIDTGANNGIAVFPLSDNVLRLDAGDVLK